MGFDFVLPQVLPCTKLFATLFAGIKHPPVGLLFRGFALRHVIADQPLCNPDQVLLVAGRFYIEICIIIKESVEALQKAICLHLFRMCRNVSPDNIGPIGFKVPRCN